jgi:hypothetical protein
MGIYEYLTLISLVFLDCEFDRAFHAPPHITEISSRRLLLLFVSFDLYIRMEQCDPQGSVDAVITSYNLEKLSILFTSIFVLMVPVGILV